VTPARLIGWLLIGLLVAVPAARSASDVAHDAREHAFIKHAPRTPSTSLRQGALAGQPPLPAPVIVGRVVAVDDRGRARVVSEPPFVPPRG
jgi:hypothetical protein